MKQRVQSSHIPPCHRHKGIEGEGGWRHIKAILSLPAGSPKNLCVFLCMFCSCVCPGSHSAGFNNLSSYALQNNHVFIVLLI